jgi:hypothetical protein
MTLVVENKDIVPSFISYLKTRLLRHICLILDLSKLKPFDEYFQSLEFLEASNGVIISSKRLILLAMSNLQHKRYESTTHIFINPNITYPGTGLKLVDLCKVINYGTLSIEGYPIFTETFNHFSRNIRKYVEKCSMGLG